MPHPTLSSLNILIVDDHRLLLNGTIELVQNHYPTAQIESCQTLEAALAQVSEHLPTLAIVDLSIPEKTGSAAHPSHGLTLLQTLMAQHPTLNLMVQSSHIKSLVRLMFDIDNHQGGLTIVDKSLPIETFLTRMDWALQGLTYTKGLQTQLEVKPEWLEVLHLAFEQGLQDKAIAQAMHKSERMIRHYWSKIQDALEVYPEAGKNIRSLTQIRAREQGLID